MKKILIVEDDLLQEYFLNKAMKYLGYDVIGSTTLGTHAIELATKMSPDIILMDINLGGKLNGVESAIKILKKIDCFIIYTTGNLDENLIKQAKKTHPSTILTKPITAEMINQSIENYLNTLK